MEEGHARGADEIELIPDLAFQQGRESGTPELAPDRVPPDASTSRSLPRWSCHWRWEQKQRRTAGRQRESVDGEASQNLTHRNSTMRDAAAPMTLSMAAELRPSGPPRAVSKLRHAHGGGGRAQTAWLPPRSHTIDIPRPSKSGGCRATGSTSYSPETYSTTENKRDVNSKNKSIFHDLQCEHVDKQSRDIQYNFRFSTIYQTFAPLQEYRSSRDWQSLAS